MHPQYTPTVVEKLCPGCGETKPRAEFRPDARRKDGLSYYCKPCKQVADAAYYRDHGSQVRSRTGQYYRDNREKISRERSERRRSDPEWRERKAAGERRWRAQHPDKVRENNQRWYADNGLAKSRPGFLMRRYGLTVEAYDALFLAQGGVCAICHREERARTPQGGVKALHVDHDHRTGIVRGLLCHRCNVAIGYLEDDPERLRAASAYLAAVLRKED